MIKKGNRESGIGNRESEPTPNPSQEGLGNRESGIGKSYPKYLYTLLNFAFCLLPFASCLPLLGGVRGGFLLPFAFCLCPLALFSITLYLTIQNCQTIIIIGIFKNSYHFLQFKLHLFRKSYIIYQPGFL
ncbi:hypothetical protein [Moorena sp. SIO3B2]|uniref:hypothetical protein n=1 Tax=Moorena sp. SIO3B2 TaxID=2607827 RepID=UPI0013CD7AE2|nr:hypothetical protein [Moorena sp. SIO3B2]NEP36161.1 hypothetical protein [Moorena sp. SIO3B2]